MIVFGFALRSKNQKLLGVGRGDLGSRREETDQVGGIGAAVLLMRSGGHVVNLLVMLLIPPIDPYHDNACQHEVLAAPPVP